MSIKINDLKPMGSELLSDSETFMNELSGDELNDIKGGAITFSISRRTFSFSRSKVSLTF